MIKENDMKVYSNRTQQQEIDLLRDTIDKILSVPLFYTDHQKMAEKMHKIARKAKTLAAANGIWIWKAREGFTPATGQGKSGGDYPTNQAALHKKAR